MKKVDLNNGMYIFSEKYYVKKEIDDPLDDFDSPPSILHFTGIFLIVKLCDVEFIRKKIAS